MAENIIKNCVNNGILQLRTMAALEWKKKWIPSSEEMRDIILGFLTPFPLKMKDDFPFPGIHNV